MTDTRLYRWAALAGVLSASVLVVNVLRRAELVPANALTHAVAPLAAVLALFTVTGLYLWQREAAGRLGLVAYAVSTAGFAGAAGTEVATHFVLAHLPMTQVDRLVAGPSRPAFAVIAAVFSLGAVLLGVTMIRSGRVPRTAAAGYLVTMTAFAWRNALPEPVVTVDGVLSAAVVVWLSTVLWQAQGAASGARMVRPRPLPDRPRPARG